MACIGMLVNNYSPVQQMKEHASLVLARAYINCIRGTTSELEDRLPSHHRLEHMEPPSFPPN